MSALATNRLNEIATTANTEHAQIESAMRAMRESLARAVRIGTLLIEAKGLVRHGAWGLWLRDHCTFSERTAQNYMRLSARYPELAKSATVADLTYREAVALLAEPKADPLEIPEESLAGFLRTLEALREIRDNHLYQKDYSTFEDYCRERWGISQSLMELI